MEFGDKDWVYKIASYKNEGVDRQIVKFGSPIFPNRLIQSHIVIPNPTNEMQSQTRSLLQAFPNVPPFIQPLLNAYAANPNNLAGTELITQELYAEPYYGDYNNCSVVLLTHNPGRSEERWKGSSSDFEQQILTHPDPSIPYHEMATGPAFPNPATNGFYHGIANQIHQHFQGIHTFSGRPFVRDLVPYHSDSFGTINMAACAQYLYDYFFNQVLHAANNSELYTHINNKKLVRPASVVYTRGSAWRKPNNGLTSIGWDLIGRIYGYCSVFKANIQRIGTIVHIDPESYATTLLNHDNYIVAISIPLRGAPYGIYQNNRAPLQPLPLTTIIERYDNPELYPQGVMDRNTEMDAFINLFR